MVRDLRNALQSAFAHPDREQRLAARARIFARTNARLAEIEFRTERYRQWRDVQWTIPLVLSLDLYGGETPLFERALKLCGGDLARFLETIGGLPRDKDGLAALRTWVSAQESRGTR